MVPAVFDTQGSDFAEWELGYFVPRVRALIGPAANTVGFDEVATSSLGATSGVLFRSSQGVELGFSYWIEDVPRYTLVAGVRYLDAEGPAEDVLHGFPEEVVFCDSDSLDVALKRIAVWIRDCGSRALLDLASIRRRLEEAAARYQMREAEEHDGFVAEDCRNAAQDAWRSGDWAAVIVHLGRIPAGRMRPSDTARLRIAERRL